MATRENTAMSIDPTLTVAEILNLYPEARPVLAGLGLDACFGGRHALEFACRAHGMPLEDVLAALRAAAAPRRLIHSGMSVREVIEKYPSTLAVFDRHGLMGCGGSRGPVEPLGWFAQVHHVELDGLLEEIEAAARAPAPSEPEEPSPEDWAEENLYRRFLKAALLFTFTGGAALGAWALILMALRGHLGGIGRGLLQVHGHYQLFGWVGLFVVGVAYHILPRLTGVRLPSYRLASISFVLLVAGTILRTVQALEPDLLRTGLLVSGALLELAGCALFFGIVAAILGSQTGGVKSYQAYLLLGSGWLVVSALLNLWHAGYLVARSAFEIPPHLNIPYLTIFLVGFVTSWILGVSLRTLPVFMGLRTRPAVASALTVPLAASVALLALGENWLLAGGGATGRLLFGVGGFGTALTLGVFTWALGILGPASGDGEPGLDRRYEKFIRLGYAWLLISGAMLTCFSVLAIAGREMDHALVGAYRHAITVGFITTVMVGMASRIVPVFRGVPLHSPRLSEITFWLLATGNLMRVLFQSLSALYGPAWLRITAMSGVLELTALLLFGYNLWNTLNARSGEASPVDRLPPIARETKVGDLLAAYPALLTVFVGNGFSALANPLLRRTLARGVSVGQACRMHGVDIESFLGQLAEARQRPKG